MMHKVTVIGAGFAGLTAVRHIRKLGKDIEITLISPRAELHYLPRHHLDTRRPT